MCTNEERYTARMVCIVQLFGPLSYWVVSLCTTLRGARAQWYLVILMFPKGLKLQRDAITGQSTFVYKGLHGLHENGLVGRLSVMARHGLAYA